MVKKTQQLKRMEADLRKPTKINSINDYISLMHRYREYMEQFNKQGFALAKKLLKGNHQEIPTPKLGFKLHFDCLNDRLVFRNETAVTFYEKGNSNLSITQLIGLYDNSDFNGLKADIDTPLIISGKVKAQLPNKVFKSCGDCDINGIISLLSSLRPSRIESLMESI